MRLFPINAGFKIHGIWDYGLFNMTIGDIPVQISRGSSTSYMALRLEGSVAKVRSDTICEIYGVTYPIGVFFVEYKDKTDDIGLIKIVMMHNSKTGQDINQLLIENSVLFRDRIRFEEL